MPALLTPVRFALMALLLAPATPAFAITETTSSQSAPQVDANPAATPVPEKRPVHQPVLPPEPADPAPALPAAIPSGSSLSRSMEAAREFKTQFGRAPHADELRAIMSSIKPADPNTPAGQTDAVFSQALSDAKTAQLKGESIGAGTSLPPNKALQDLIKQAAIGGESKTIAYDSFIESLEHIPPGDKNSCLGAQRTLLDMRGFYTDAEADERANKALHTRCGKALLPGS